MAVSEEFNTFVLDQLNRVLPVTSRRMFGGVGYYAEGLFFAIADNDTLYFKVDDMTRKDYEREELPAFQPYGPDTPSMSYFAVPPRLLESGEDLESWLRRAVEVAARAKVRPARRSS